MEMDFRQASPKKTRTAKAPAKRTTKDTSGQARVVPLAQQKQNTLTTSLSRKRSRQEIAEAECAFVDNLSSDDDYDPEVIEDAAPDVAERPKRRKTSTAHEAETDGIAAETPVQQCLKDLRKMCSKVGLLFS